MLNEVRQGLSRFIPFPDTEAKATGANPPVVAAQGRRTRRRFPFQSAVRIGKRSVFLGSRSGATQWLLRARHT